MFCECLKITGHSNKLELENTQGGDNKSKNIGDEIATGVQYKQQNECKVILNDQTSHK